MHGIFIFFLIPVAVILFSGKLKANAGVFALGTAFILGFIWFDTPASSIIAKFPTSLFFNFFISTYFYGFAAENGTLQKLAGYIMYLFRNAKWAAALGLYLAVFTISAFGALDAAAIIMSPIAFHLAFQMGFHPILASAAVWGGSMVGGSVIWSSSSAVSEGLFSQVFPQAAVTSYLNRNFLWMVVLFTLFYVVLFVVTKGYRVRAAGADVRKPERFDAAQKKTLWVLLGTIFIVVVPSVLNMLVPNPVTGWASANLRINVLATIGIVVFSAMKVADPVQIITKRVPWNAIILITGMATLMSLATEMGVIEYLGNWLQTSVSSNLIVPVFVLIMAVLSFFVSGGAILPAFLPLLPALAAASGQPPEAIMLSANIGLCASSFSPFSQGGAIALTGCSNETMRETLIKTQVALSIVCAAYIVIASFTGIFSL